MESAWVCTCSFSLQPPGWVSVGPLGVAVVALCGVAHPGASLGLSVQEPLGGNLVFWALGPLASSTSL